MKKFNHHIGPGAASLLLVAVVVSMSVLGLLALMDARIDHRLMQRSRDFTSAEYALSAQAEQDLAALDSVLLACGKTAETEAEYIAAVAAELPDGMAIDGRSVTWNLGGDTGRSLYCAVEIAPLGSQPRFKWKEHVFSADAGDNFIEIIE